ncbi:zinc finger domain-containing protein [Edaphobacter sp.]|uniref:zinc finger domain-containing protein n=1 Tax=Edaphobacter sp. TaxID=1934404 RepID=UPI003BB8E1DF
MFISERRYRASTRIAFPHLHHSGCCLVACPTCGAAPGVWCWQGEPTANGKRVLIRCKPEIDR